MSPRQSLPASRARAAPRPRRRGRRVGDLLTLSRSDYLGPVPTGDGGFVSATISLYPGDPSVVGISALYAEYRYTALTARIVPRASTAALGTHFLGFRYAPPAGAPVSLSAASTLAGFATASTSHGPPILSRLSPAAAARRWFRLVPNPSSLQLLDPDIVQAWLVVGADSLQSGLVSGDLHIRYTIQFRGSLDTPGALSTLDGEFTTTLRL